MFLCIHHWQQRATDTRPLHACTIPYPSHPLTLCTDKLVNNTVKLNSIDTRNQIDVTDRTSMDLRPPIRYAIVDLARLSTRFSSAHLSLLLFISSNKNNNVSPSRCLSCPGCSYCCECRGGSVVRARHHVAETMLTPSFLFARDTFDYSSSNAIPQCSLHHSPLWSACTLQAHPTAPPPTPRDSGESTFLLPFLRHPSPSFPSFHAPLLGVKITQADSSDREQAQEGQYIRKREEEALKAAREKLHKAQADLEAQQKKVDGLPKHD